MKLSVEVEEKLLIVGVRVVLRVDVSVLLAPCGCCSNSARIITIRTGRRYPDMLHYTRKDCSFNQRAERTEPVTFSSNVRINDKKGGK